MAMTRRAPTMAAVAMSPTFRSYGSVVSLTASALIGPSYVLEGQGIGEARVLGRDEVHSLGSRRRGAEKDPHDADPAEQVGRMEGHGGAAHARHDEQLDIDPLYDQQPYGPQ